MNETTSTTLTELNTTYAALEQGLKDLRAARLSSQTQQITESLGRDLEKYRKLSKSTQISEEKVAELNRHLRRLQARLTHALNQKSSPPVDWGEENSFVHKIIIRWADDGPEATVVRYNFPVDPTAVYFATLAEAEAALEEVKPLIGEIAETYLSLREMSKALREPRLNTKED